ncbi:hypothetical protein [Thiomicrorhabdus aquaedulcis]|uniref:hypothetical protein n=1 Tax=Thiomicrorhabdus aquaedulcis TaxID=2211106 RepID=UPI000FD845B2|nr:hypothetical protein [Thiomicrorhabdus aquaedulcis]
MLIPNSKFGCYLSFAAIVVMLGGVSGCQESAVKRDPLAPPVSKDFIPAGHIQAKQKVEDIIPGSPGIPSVMDATRPKLPDLNAAEQLNLYSVSAVQVPVAELLHQIAKDSGKQIDLYSGIQGRVTINAINQPLEKVLERIADQVGLMYVIDGGTIVIKPDIPEWRNYNVDYVFIDKVTNDTINMKMNVSAGAMGTTGTTSTANTGSSTNVTVKSEHKFWERLKSNIEVLAHLDPLENMKTSQAVQAISAKSNDIATTDLTIPPVKQTAAQAANKSANTVINPEAGVISVYTTSKKHKAIKEYIADISVRAQRQVLIEATVVEVVLNDQYQAGIDWTLMGNRAFGADGGLQISSPFSGPSNGFQWRRSVLVSPAGIGIFCLIWLC